MFRHHMAISIVMSKFNEIDRITTMKKTHLTTKATTICGFVFMALLTILMIIRSKYDTVYLSIIHSIVIIMLNLSICYRAYIHRKNKRTQDNEKFEEEHQADNSDKDGNT